MTSLRPTLLALALALPIAAALADDAKPVAPAPAPAKPLMMQDVLDASKPGDWRPLDPANTLYMELESGRVVIELAPAFAPRHADNIRTLVREKYFDGLVILRSQDNFVVQWGDPDADAPEKRRPLGKALEKLPAEFTRPAEGLAFTRLPDVDGWAPEVGFVDAMPAARDPKAGLAWPAHCYGTVGAGRDAEPDSSNGSSLYVVTGQAPRQLDRNITTVGRVVQGMERLSVIPRGAGAGGFYEKPEQATPIRAIRLASEIPEAEREKIEVLRTDTPTFQALVESRRNRRDDWYKHPAGHIDLCNVPVPVRPIPDSAD